MAATGTCSVHRCPRTPSTTTDLGERHAGAEVPICDLHAQAVLSELWFKTDTVEDGSVIFMDSDVQQVGDEIVNVRVIGNGSERRWDAPGLPVLRLRLFTQALAGEGEPQERELIWSLEQAGRVARLLSELVEAELARRPPPTDA